MVRGLLWALANLVFFLPRRRVTMTIEFIPRDRLPDATREQLNPFLEQWYNRDGRETPTFVRYHFLSARRDFEFPQFQHQLDIDFDKLMEAPGGEEIRALPTLMAHGPGVIGPVR